MEILFVSLIVQNRPKAGGMDISNFTQIMAPHSSLGENGETANYEIKHFRLATNIRAFFELSFSHPILQG